MVKRVMPIGLMVFGLLVLNSPDAFAEGQVLTDLFNTEAFRGSFEWFSKLQWLGYFLQMIISVGCFIGVFSISLQTVITVVYFSNRPFWDTVSTEKDGVGGSLDKMISGVKGIGGGNLKGLDAIVNLFYAFLPDIKKISDMSEENRASNSLEEDDSIVTWFIKTAGRKIILILFLSMGLNGSLMQVYGMVVDGLGVVTERVVSYNLEDKVNELLNTGSKHTFTIGATGVPQDVLKESIAKNIYSKVLSQVSNKTTDVNLSVGKKVEEWVVQQLSEDALLNKLNGRWTGDPLTADNMTDRDWKNVKADVTISKAEGINSDFNTSVATFTGGDSDGFSIHIIVRLTKKQNDKNIFEVKPNS